MWNDVVDLQDFYQSQLGQVARRMLRRRIRAIWPDTRGMAVAGIGFATPYLRPFIGEAERVVAIMPAQQGVLHWPRDSPNLVALASDSDLPLPDASVDRLLLVHAIECSEDLRNAMRECWRILAGGGRMLVVVPNRHGLWARTERSPFGYGRPYTTGQIAKLLRDSMFTPELTAHALYLPPTRARMALASAVAIENLGARFFQPVSGVVIVEATKQIYAGVSARPVRRQRRLVALPGGMAGARAGRDRAEPRKK